MATYDNASRPRFPNRDKLAATRVRAVKFVDDLLEIARGCEQARDAEYGQSPRDAQLDPGLAKSICCDNQRGLQRFGGGNSIRREVLSRCVSRLTNTKARKLSLQDRHRAHATVGQPLRLPFEELARGAPALQQDRASRRHVWRIVRTRTRAA